MFVDAAITSHDVLRNIYVGMINFNTGEREAKAGPREHYSRSLEEICEH